MSKKYALKIYQSGKDGYVRVCSMESDDPFLAIQKGDFINPSTWNIYCLDSLEAEYRESNYGIALKVTGLEHSLVQKEDGNISQHKLNIFTRLVENNQALLFADSEPNTTQTSES
ncbi:MAG TPA: hypothetical protein VGD05_00005 [Pyrinomonadaceae bacterium]|jgi:hypothetical protein